VDTKPDPTQAKIHKIIEPEEVFKKTGYSRPHTVHCGPEGIYVSTLPGSCEAAQANRSRDLFVVLS
jgi:selenium-binding protein 1